MCVSFSTILSISLLVNSLFVRKPVCLLYIFLCHSFIITLLVGISLILGLVDSSLGYPRKYAISAEKKGFLFFWSLLFIHSFIHSYLEGVSMYSGLWFLSLTILAHSPSLDFNIPSYSLFSIHIQMDGYAITTTMKWEWLKVFFKGVSDRVEFGVWCFISVSASIYLSIQICAYYQNDSIELMRLEELREPRVKSIDEEVGYEW